MHKQNNCRNKLITATLGSDLASWNIKNIVKYAYEVHHL